jgi:predicted Fe-Mo cluster-binding NifX family protein
MRIVVTAEGAGLDASASSVFGRCQAYVFVETDSMEAETLENPAINTASGAGIQAAQFVVEKGVEAVVTGNVGPNAYSVFQASGVPVYLLQGGTVRDVVEAFRKGELSEARGATGPAHGGLGRGRGTGRGRGGRGADGSTGRSPSGSPRRQPVPSSIGGQAASASPREREIVELQEMAGDLRKQLAEVMDRLDQLEREE